jgi:hypothetical protein
LGIVLEKKWRAREEGWEESEFFFFERDLDLDARPKKKKKRTFLSSFFSSPVDSISTSTNSKYWSIDHRDSTAPSAYDTKKFKAAGVKTS